ncbi:hypothetical protein CALVIDRAFT_332237 [Calocera viscosa TUFC12733]|uniref:Uncharacterized protein n=1 Tax=Calocera viscosa (strain TUFC12733) TaxID=1330018 RepID=A0A167HNW3_CALVF|nr:hypothetical protein CALVIDRAFT_332237 [Calocera viscosa TUFC12733]
MKTPGTSAQGVKIRSQKDRTSRNQINHTSSSEHTVCAAPWTSPAYKRVGPNHGLDAASPRLFNQRINVAVSIMAFSLSRLGTGFVTWLRFLFSRKGIPTWKGTLAYTIAYILAFIFPFTEKIAAPPQVSGLMIIVVLSTPGVPVGIFLDGVFWLILGIMMGALNAYILTYLGQVLVAQGIVYFIFVYVYAWAKAVSLKYLAFTLLGIVWCISAVAGTLGNNGEPNIPFVVGTIQAYFWGIAVVIFVNLFVFPTSCEEIWRCTTISALQHMDTLSRLLLQSYSGNLAETDVRLRAELVGQLRREIDVIDQMLGGTYLEVMWSRWSMHDLADHTKVLHNLHEALMNISADYVSAEKAGCANEIRERFLQNSHPELRRLSAAISVTISELSSALDSSSVPLKVQDTIAELDLERQTLADRVGSDSPTEEVIQAFQRRFAEEMETHEEDLTATNSTINVLSTGPEPSSVPPKLSSGASASLPLSLRALREYVDRWTSQQLDIVGHLLLSGGFDAKDRPLTVNAPLASIADTFSQDWTLRMAGSKGGTAPYTLRLGSTPVSVDSDSTEKGGDDISMVDNHADRVAGALTRMYSLLFAANRFTAELQELHARVVPSANSPARKRLHVHLFERISKRKPIPGHTVTIPLIEAALAIGAQGTTRPTRHLWDSLLAAERFLRGPRNVYAFKLTLAIEILTILAWAPVARPWFLSYGLPLTVVTVVLLVTPTFGETYLWTLQQLGGVLGYITSLILLEIFRDVGGYAYNPYGIVCLISLWTIPLMYLMHEVPIGFPFGLLAMIFGSIYMCNEYVNVVILGAPYDSPSYAAGKALATIAVGIALGAAFQFLILRNPARRTLRKALIGLLHTNRTYLSLLHAYIRALQTPEIGSTVSEGAYNAIEMELQRREGSIRGQIMITSQMVGNVFGEPHWDAPFGADAASKVLEANEILLERLRDARTAMRSQPFHPYLAQNFISTLAPYRRQWNGTVRMALYLSAASLSSQTPLPADMLKVPWKFVNDMVQDALALSARMGTNDEGRAMLKTPDFARFWFFLLVISAATEQVQVIEEACASVYGTDETIY